MKKRGRAKQGAIEEEGLSKLLGMGEDEDEELEDGHEDLSGEEEYGMSNEAEEVEEEEDGFEEELLNLDELNTRKARASGEEEKRRIKEVLEQIGHMVKLRVKMEGGGSPGEIHPSEFPKTLAVFKCGEARVWAQLQKLSSEACTRALPELEHLARQAGKSAPEKRNLSRNRPVKYTIKKGIELKTEKASGAYEDRPFFTALCKDYCYKEGINLHAGSREGRDKKSLGKREQISYKVHEEMVGFSAAAGGYEWEDAKMDELYPGLLKAHD